MVGDTFPFCFTKTCKCIDVGSSIPAKSLCQFLLNSEKYYAHFFAKIFRHLSTAVNTEYFDSMILRSITVLIANASKVSHHLMGKILIEFGSVRHIGISEFFCDPQRVHIKIVEVCNVLCLNEFQTVLNIICKFSTVSKLIHEIWLGKNFLFMKTVTILVSDIFKLTVRAAKGSKL